MKLLKFKNMAMIGAMSVAGVGLIGVGAHATFTTSTASAQTVTAGTLAVTLSSPGATGDGTLGNPLVLAASPYEGSTFAVANDVLVHNNGNIPATETSITISDTTDGSAASLAMVPELWACLSSDGVVIFNEPLTTATGYGTFAVGATVLPPNDEYMLTVYAGNAPTICGATFTGVSGGSFNNPGDPTVPAVANPDALSLTNPAEGGVVSPTMTMTYSG
jgi:hypothetical protein